MGTIMPDTFLRLHNVKRRVGLSRSQIYLLGSRGEFPKQVKISSRKAVAWIEREIDAWIEEKIQARGESAKPEEAAK